MASNVQEEKRGFSPKRLVGRMTRSFKDMRGEMKRVVWPGKKQVLNNTGIVLMFMLLAAIVIGGFDTIVGFLFSLSLGV